MCTSLRLTVASLTAALLLATATGTASANRLLVSSTGFRIVWRPIAFEGVEVEVPVRCNITVEGTLHSTTLVKTSGALIGYVTRAMTPHPCNAFESELWIYNGTENPLGQGVAATSLPWHVTYRAFAGTLPRITKVLVLFRGIKFSMHSTTSGCLAVYGGPEESIVGEATVEAGGVITGFAFEMGNRIRRKEFTAGCPAFATFRETGQVTQLGSATTITVRLT